MPEMTPQIPAGAVALSPADLQTLSTTPPAPPPPQTINGLPVVPAKPGTDTGPQKLQLGYAVPDPQGTAQGGLPPGAVPLSPDDLKGLTSAPPAQPPPGAVPLSADDLKSLTPTPDGSVSRPQAVQMYLDSARTDPDTYKNLYIKAAQADAPTAGLHAIGSVWDAAKSVAGSLADGIAETGSEIGRSIEPSAFAKPTDSSPWDNISAAVKANSVQFLQSTKQLVDNMKLFDLANFYIPEKEDGQLLPPAEAQAMRQKRIAELAGEQFDQDIQTGELVRNLQQGQTMFPAGTAGNTDPKEVQKLQQNPALDPSQVAMFAAPIVYGRLAGAVTEAGRAQQMARVLTSAAENTPGRLNNAAALGARATARGMNRTANFINSSPVLRGLAAGGATFASGKSFAEAAVAAVSAASKEGGTLGAALFRKGESVAENFAKAAEGSAEAKGFGKFAYGTVRAAGKEGVGIVQSQLANAPFVLASEDPHDRAAAIAGGLLYHGAQEGVSRSLAKAHSFFGVNPFAAQPLGPEPRKAVKDYGTFPDLDVSHQAATSKLDSKSSNFVQTLRDFLTKTKGGELYTLDQKGIDAALAAAVKRGEITKAQAAVMSKQNGWAHFLVDKDGNKVPVAFANLSRSKGIAAGHEVSHLLWEHVLTDEQKAAWTKAATKTFTEKGIAAFRSTQDGLRAASGLPPLSDAQVMEELFAEHTAAVLNGAPMGLFGPKASGSWNSFTRATHMALGSALESMGVKLPTAAPVLDKGSVVTWLDPQEGEKEGRVIKDNGEGTFDIAYTDAKGDRRSQTVHKDNLSSVQDGVTRTPLGVEPSMKLASLTENMLQARALDGEALGTKEEPEEAEAPGVAPKPGQHVVNPEVLAKEKATAGFPDNGAVEYNGHKYEKRNGVWYVAGETESLQPAGSPADQDSFIDELNRRLPKNTVENAAETGESSQNGGKTAGSDENAPVSPVTTAEKPFTPTTPIRSSDKAVLDAFGNAAKPGDSAEHNKALFKDIIANPNAPGRAVEITHVGAESPKKNAGQLAREGERLGRLTNTPNGKVIVPFAENKKGDGVFALDTHKILQNFEMLGAHTHDPYYTSGEATRDLQNYLRNQSNGLSGGGEKLTRPKSTLDNTIPAETPGYVPVKIPDANVQKLNVAMGYPKPKGLRDIEGAKARDAFFRQFAEDNGRKTYLTPAGFTETNPYRAQLEKSGFNTADLHDATSQIMYKDIAGKAKPRPELNATRGSTGITKAGFMPNTDRVKDTPEFKRWFGESKVVDSDGKPLVVYHGSGADFTEFRTRASKENNRLGAYFSDDPKAVSDLIKYRRGEAHLQYPTFLKLEKPFDVSQFDEEEDQLKLAKNIQAAIGLSDDDVRLLDRHYTSLPYAMLEGADKHFDMVAKLKKRGYDGIIFDGGNEGKTYVAFRPEQIKSATGNNGKFDPKNPDIRYMPSVGAENEHAKYIGEQEDGAGGHFPLFNLKHDIDGHPADSTVSADTLKKAGIPLPGLREQGNQDTRDTAADYMKDSGRPFEPHTDYARVDPERAKAIADFYDEAKHAPSDPAVKKAYTALTNETKAQWDAMQTAGIKAEPWEGKGEPYKDSAAMMKDVRENKHLWFLPTDDSSFGSEGTSLAKQDNPLLENSGVKVNGHALLNNDLFRAVHDYFGHTAEGFEFGPRGEYNAYLAHSKMFSDEAKPALAAETLAQNSWVNYGKHLRRPDGSIPERGDADFKPLAKRPFADQKSVVVPSPLLDEGAKFMPDTRGEEMEKEAAKKGYFFETLPQGRGGFLVTALDKDGDQIGGLSVSHYNDKGFVRSVGVDADHRGHGLGEIMYRRAARELQERGIEKLEGLVSSKSALGVREKVFGKPSKLDKSAIHPADLPEHNDWTKDRASLRVTSKVPPDAKFMPPADPSKEHVDRAAIRNPFRGGEIYTGEKNDSHQNIWNKHPWGGDLDLGFVSSKGRFLSRQEAYDLAREAGQVKKGTYRQPSTQQGGAGLGAEVLKHNRKFMPAAAEKLPHAVPEDTQRLVHYGQPGITEVHPDKFGKSGLTPKSELAGEPRSYFYVEGRENKNDPSVSRKDVYSTQVLGSDIYDGDKDPLGYRKMVNRQAADEMLKDAGYHGISRTSADGKYRQVELYKPQAVSPKNKDGSTGVPGTPSFMPNPSKEPFYDTIDRALDSWQPKGTPEQLLAHLNKTKGTKEQAAWIGLDDFLKDKKSVTKEDVRKFVQDNAVHVKDVTLGTKGPLSNKEQEKLSDLEQIYEDVGHDGMSDDAIHELRTLRDKDGSETDAKYEDYQLPGGENYRELLLTLPSENVDARNAWLGETKGEYQWALPGGKKISPMFKSVGEAHAWKNEKTDGPQPFKSSHFDEPNILAHVRYNEREIPHDYGVTDAINARIAAALNAKPHSLGSGAAEAAVNKGAITPEEAKVWSEKKEMRNKYNPQGGPHGSKMLFLEEVQSDWHQQGRQKGYSTMTPEKAKAQYEAADAAYLEKLRETDGGMYIPEHDKLLETYPELKTLFDARERAHLVYQQNLGSRSSGVPDAPFKTSWPALAMKRMIRLAAEKGMDKIGWTTGEQQAERYDLSKQVHSIGVDKNLDGSYLVYAKEKPQDVNRVLSGNAKESDLANIIGKELARQAVEKTKDGKTSFTASGEGLKVGGEGMKGFYDKILPGVANELGKKFGVKVATSRLQGEGASEYELRKNSPEVHTFDITPEMKASALQGLPMFMPATYKSIAKHLTPEEREGVRADTAQHIVDTFNSLPHDKEFEAAANMGMRKRGWYMRAADALRTAFGPDTEKFVSLLAATSPRQSVQENLQMAAKVWDKWEEAGRPTDEKGLRELVAPHIEMEARLNNSVRALKGEDLVDTPVTKGPKSSQLSGFKVESFRKNLLGDLNEVTNDAWMAQFSGIPQSKFGTRAGYHAMNAKVRRVAEKLGLQPAEVQETIWSFFKTLVEKTRVDTPSASVLHALTENDIAHTPEFADEIINNPRVKAFFEKRGLGGAKAPAEHPQASGKLVDAHAKAGGSKTVLGRIAARAQAIKDAELAGAPKAEPVPAENPF